MGTTYTCEHCGGTFKGHHDAARAHAESVANFGKDGHAPDMAVICDVCFKALALWSARIGKPLHDFSIDES